MIMTIESKIILTAVVVNFLAVVAVTYGLVSFLTTVNDLQERRTIKVYLLTDTTCISRSTLLL